MTCQTCCGTYANELNNVHCTICRTTPKAGRYALYEQRTQCEYCGMCHGVIPGYRNAKRRPCPICQSKKVTCL